MTKTTNKETSKKLAEIGFNKPTIFFRRIADGEFFINTPPDLKNPEKFFIKAYDLETLLDALPAQLEGYLGDSYLSFNKSKHRTSIGYSISNDDEYIKNLYSRFEDYKNESLADTAGRLIILLYENNLIKF